MSNVNDELSEMMYCDLILYFTLENPKSPLCERLPLRRINQIYTIATSTKLDISSVKVPEHLDDKYFRRTKPTKKSKKDEEEIFETKKEV
ncbi:hypothetical protein JTE90_014420 [Oedothorax gibbosus]|uniref:Uncharacterized protein n=1 Tax=Oedothorax gibbosus TaxID=931172 RepID=A0AAV6TK06_9ARAC|nr:hypothetical protein JTE90_014420 [Oedothorax gibbosus]